MQVEGAGKGTTTTTTTTTSSSSTTESSTSLSTPDSHDNDNDNDSDNPYVCEADAWAWEGMCEVTPDFSLKGALELLLCSDYLVNNPELCDTYNNVIKNFLTGILDPGIPILSVCTGEFSGRDIKRGLVHQKNLGCRDIPVARDKDFGVVAARFQGGFTNVNTKYCSVTAPPDCGYTWALSFDLGLINWLLETVPQFFAAASPAVALMALILDLAVPLTELAFGISERGGFEVPLEVYTPFGFQRDELLANFFFKNGVTGVFLPDDVNAILPTTGGGATYWAWNEDAEVNVQGILNGDLDPMVLGLQYSTANIRTINSKFKLGDYTGGLLPSLDLFKASETGYMVRDDLGVLGRLEPGYYTGYGAEVPFIGDNIKLLCNIFGGLGVFECPEVIRFEVSSRFGWYQELYTGNLGLGFEWFGEPIVQCLYIPAPTDELECNSNGEAFSIKRNDVAGLSVRVVDERGGVPVETKSFVISKEAYETLGNFSAASVEYYEGAASVNSGSTHDDGNRQLAIEDLALAQYGFGWGKICAAVEDGRDDAVTIFDTRDSSFELYSLQYGHDGSLRNCFLACVLHAATGSLLGDTNKPCCEYQTAVYGSTTTPGACLLRTNSTSIRTTATTTTSADDHNNNNTAWHSYASLSFQEDFRAIASSQVSQ